jgi:hypothetical protein
MVMPNVSRNGNCHSAMGLEKLVREKVRMSAASNGQGHQSGWIGAKGRSAEAKGMSSQIWLFSLE